MRVRVLALAAFLLPVPMFADVITTFTFDNMSLTENKGGTKITGTVTGEVTIDVTTGKTVSGDFTATYGGTPPATYSFSEISTATKNIGSSKQDWVTVFLDPSIPITFDLEYTDIGGAITLCSEDTNGFKGNGACDQGRTGEQTFLDSNFLGNGDLDLVSGSLDPVPEPSSILMLGTGLLGALGAARRRFIQK